MTQIVISGSGLWTPEQSISNEELVASYNAYADKFNTENASAIAAGAQIIEKHFTISKKLPGPDHICSLSPKEMKELVKNLRKTEIILGETSFRSVTIF